MAVHVAERPEQPIAPGKEGLIKASFNSSGKPGPNFKSIMVYANTEGSEEHKLNFMVEVLQKHEGNLDTESGIILIAVSCGRRPSLLHIFKTGIQNDIFSCFLTGTGIRRRNHATGSAGSMILIFWFVHDTSSS